MESSDWIKGELIGKGSFGSVNLAYDKLNRQVFAVKSVPLDSHNSIASLENEIEILRSLNSSYIVPYLGDSTTRDSRNLHIEHVPGGTLADVAGKLDEHEVRAFTRCIVNALFYLHSVAGVVHSDVKGRNVLSGLGLGQAKLADFGSARRISDDRQTIGGTPLWMAPEVIRGSPATTESDIWSLGCTVIEMVTGGSPWSNNYKFELLEIGFGGKLPEFPAKLSKLGQDFLDKCLRRRPEKRWTAEELLQHPFLLVESVAELSPRCVLDWVSSEFDGDDDDHDGIDDDVVNFGRERIRELVWDSEGIVKKWDSEGWELVRTGTEDIGEFWRGELGTGNYEGEASGNELSNEIRGSSDFNSSCSFSINLSQQVERVRKERCLDWFGVLFHLVLYTVVNANPIFLTLVLHLYSFGKLRILIL